MNQVIKISEKNTTVSSDAEESISSDSSDIVHELDRHLVEILRSEGPLTRSKLVNLTGVARSTLYDSLLRLILKGYVVRFSEERTERGRPKVYYKILQ